MIREALRKVGGCVLLFGFCVIGRLGKWFEFIDQVKPLPINSEAPRFEEKSFEHEILVTDIKVVDLLAMFFLF